MTPGCFKSKVASSPRTSTPVNSSANRRMSGPRPQFITPYRKQEAKRDVSPLARCSSSGIPVSGSAEVQGSGVVEPSSKKARTSASNSRMDMKNGYHGLVSKVGKLILFFFLNHGSIKHCAFPFHSQMTERNFRLLLNRVNSAI